MTASCKSNITIYIFLLFSLSILLSACFPGVYKLDIPQGNILDEESIDQIELGMTKRQIRYLLGTPLLIDSFNQDRWIYYYSHQYYGPRDSIGKFYEARLILEFERGLLNKIDRQIPERESDAQDLMENDEATKDNNKDEDRDQKEQNQEGLNS